jgi:chemotaxis protein histidine kinase CheA
LARDISDLNLNTPELTRIFRDELEERSSRLVAAARSLRQHDLDENVVQDLVRDAHTIKVGEFAWL